MRIDKSFLTNLIALCVLLSGTMLSGPLRPWLINAGLFALSGGLTNWLAVHMLFERVPGFYGSGVIPLHFDEFRSGIRNLIMQQFFSEEHLERFMRGSAAVPDEVEDDLRDLLANLDLDRAFDSLGEVIVNSSLGSMLSVFGGRDALESLREPFKARMRQLLRQVVDSDAFREQLAQKLSRMGAAPAEVRRRIEAIVEQRLQELTPDLVKEIMQAMIKRHLGWLVVWGGVIGAVVGLLVTAAGQGP